MKGLENQSWLLGLIASNFVAVVYLLTAIKAPRLSRLLFFLLFAWACFANWKTSQQMPEAYLEYANLALIQYYKNFIEGWFSKNIALAVGIIASCQGLIAFSITLKSWAFKFGCICGIAFLIAIAPLGVGSGFPCTLIFAAAMIVLYGKGHQFLWTPGNKIAISNHTEPAKKFHEKSIQIN